MQRKFIPIEGKRFATLEEAKKNYSYANKLSEEEDQFVVKCKITVYPYASCQSKARPEEVLIRMKDIVYVDENGDEIWFPQSGTRSQAIAEAITRKIYPNSAVGRPRVFTGRYEHNLLSKRVEIEIDNDSVEYVFVVGQKPMQYFGGTQNYDVLKLVDQWVVAIPIARALALANNVTIE